MIWQVVWQRIQRRDNEIGVKKPNAIAENTDVFVFIYLFICLLLLEFRLLISNEMVFVSFQFKIQVNEHVRQKMFQLRRTWDGVFPLSRLHMLDYRISKIDPNWPTSQPCNTTKIHLNPKFPVGEVSCNGWHSN